MVKNELRNYGKPFCPAFLMVGHDCIYGGVSRRRVVSARDRGSFSSSTVVSHYKTFTELSTAASGAQPQVRKESVKCPMLGAWIAALMPHANLPSEQYRHEQLSAMQAAFSRFGAANGGTLDRQELPDFLQNCMHRSMNSPAVPQSRSLREYGADAATDGSHTLARNEAAPDARRHSDSHRENSHISISGLC